MKEYAIKLKSKLPRTEMSIFAVMSKMANDFGAINLSQGFPDFDCDPKLQDLVYKYMRSGYNQYAPMPGILPLRQRISSMIEELRGVHYNPETEITITSGATEALFDVISAVVSEDDEVIFFEPAYDSYVPAINLSGGVPVGIPLSFPDYKINWDHVRNRINQKVKLIILNSPHNPSGSLVTKEDLDILADLIKDKDIFILSDEVYEFISFDGNEHFSVSQHPILKHRSFVISSFGKSLHTTGWKLGYCVAPEQLTDEFRKIHQFITFSSNTPMQYAVSEYLAEKKYLELSKFYQQKRDFFLNEIKDSKFKVLNCSGTYFQLLDYSEISDMNDVEFAEFLTKEHGVATIPISVFYSGKENNKVIRVCFAKTEKTLKLAGEKLCKI